MPIQELANRWRRVMEASSEVVTHPVDTRCPVRHDTIQAEAVGTVQQFAELQGILAITRTLVSELDLNKLLDTIICQAKQLVQAHQAAVFLLTEDYQHLELAAPPLIQFDITTYGHMAIKECIAEAALRHKRVQISNNAAHDRLVKPIGNFLHATSIAALLCMPLIFRQDNLGVLILWCEGDKKFSQLDGHLIELFAAQAALALQNARLYARSQQLAAIQERHRLARDLHDSVTQTLYSIGLAAQAGIRLLERGQYMQTADSLNHIQVLLQAALAEMRENLYHLHPTHLNNGEFVKMIAQYCTLLGKRYDLSIKFVPELQRSLVAHQQNALYYIVREAIWNVIKHARARQVKIIVREEQAALLLIIKDDGIGFDPSVLVNTPSFGLRNIQERTDQLGGEMYLQSSPGQGTQLTVQFPIQFNQ